MSTQYDWYKLFNQTDFKNENLVSRTILLQLEGRGRQIFEIFRAAYVSVQYGDAFLPVTFLDANPFVIETYAVYLDANDDVWFGFEVPP